MATMIAERFEVFVPSYALAYLYNGDASGLEDEEIEALEALEGVTAEELRADMGGEHWHWGDHEPEGFHPCNDLPGEPGRRGGDVHKIELVVMKSE